MAVARHGTGVRSGLRAFASQVHPVFMLPPVAASLFGGVLAAGTDPLAAALHAVAIFAAVYTAHVKDGYVDFHLRDEDDDHPLTVTGCLLGLGGATALFGAALLGLATRVDLVAAGLTLPTWLIAYLHAPQLDMHPIGATMGYPVGIGLAILGGYYVQVGVVGSLALAFAAVFVVVLTGIKVVDDTTDVAYDRSIGKRSVAVAVGPRRAIELAYGLIAAGLVGCLGFVAIGLFPPGSVVAVAVLAAVALVARRGGPEIATMLLIRGCYVFLAVLVAAVWFEPLGRVL
ncbi:UbiA family prenyltransferase [Halovivax limisalsi]|uniref:UbiA family prenyltransferase n=1 Tax=Halovivax limisalsi TaxID=1453760 RepID=UPI001FFDAB67|nr:UbiA family prenyltransferase [Halovivax limisalsi]